MAAPSSLYSHAKRRILDILAAFPSAWFRSKAQASLKNRLFDTHYIKPEATRSATCFRLESIFSQSDCAVEIWVASPICGKSLA